MIKGYPHGCGNHRVFVDGDVLPTFWFRGALARSCQGSSSIAVASGFCANDHTHVSFQRLVKGAGKLGVGIAWCRASYSVPELSICCGGQSSHYCSVHPMTSNKQFPWSVDVIDQPLGRLEPGFTFQGDTQDKIPAWCLYERRCFRASN